MADIFRKAYRELTEAEKAGLEAIKDRAQHLHDILEDWGMVKGGRELALAKTKLEEAVMWATKAITG